MKSIKKYSSILIILIMVLLLSNSIFAAEMPSTSLNSDIVIDLQDYEDEDNFIIKIPIVSEKGSNALRANETFAGWLQVYFSRDDTLRNKFHIAYEMKADSLFNGITGTFICESTSVLKPQTYANKSINTGTITATTIYTKNLGTVIIPMGESSVRLKVNNAKVYSLLLSQWVTGITFNKVYHTGL